MDLKEGVEEELRTESRPVNIKIKSYASKVFQYIRQMDMLNDLELMRSLDPRSNKH